MSFSSQTGVPMIARRIGNYQPFWRSVFREDERYIGTQVGLITYDDDDRYKMSYLEAGLRSDHIVDGLLSIGDKNHTAQSAASPLPYDADIVVTADDEIKQRPHADRKVTEVPEILPEPEQTMAVVA